MMINIVKTKLGLHLVVQNARVLQDALEDDGQVVGVEADVAVAARERVRDLRGLLACADVKSLTGVEGQTKPRLCARAATRTGGSFPPTRAGDARAAKAPMEPTMTACASTPSPSARKASAHQSGSMP